MKKVILEGQTYYSISDAAKYLGTNAAQIRKLIGTGILKIGPQTRMGSRKLHVSSESLVEYKYKKT